jgi:integral membrane protein
LIIPVPSRLVDIIDPAMLSSPIGRLRIISLIEGASFLLLLGIAMPLKYAWGMPWAVSFVGMVHGVLFVLFCVALLNAVLVARWKLKPPFLIFLASLIPFAPLWVEHWLRKQHAREGDGP